MRQLREKNKEGGEAAMLISRKQAIKDEVIKNLLFAHKRIANTGSVADVIRLSKYLLRLAEQGNDVLIDSVAECEKEGGCYGKSCI